MAGWGKGDPEPAWPQRVLRMERRLRLGMDLPQPLTSSCSVPQRLADAAENFQKAHRWQDNIKVRTTVPSPAPTTCPSPERADVNLGKEVLPRLTG